MRYRLDVAEICKKENGKKVYIPTDEWVYTVLIDVPTRKGQEPFDVAMTMRCDLMKDPAFNDKYIRIVEIEN